VLRGLSWNILRVRSTDCWFDVEGAANRLHDALTALLTDSHAKEAKAGSDQTLRWKLGDEVEPAQAITGGLEREDLEVSMSPMDEAGLTLPVELAAAGAGSPSPDNGNAPRYRLADLSRFRAEPDQFHEFGYRTTLRGMVDAVMDTEAPLREEVLAQRIARAHGWLRTGSKIRERIQLHLRDLERTGESSGDFLWKPGTVAPMHPYRAPVDSEARRGIADIPLAELASIVVTEPALLEENDAALALARFLGVERLAATSRARLDEALRHAAALLAPPGAESP